MERTLRNRVVPAIDVIEKEEHFSMNTDDERRKNIELNPDIQNSTKLTCELCEKRFVSKSTLNNHKFLHTGEKPHACSECGRTYRLKSQLKTHQNFHSGSLKCVECDKHFTTKSNLKMHLANHTKEPLFLCSLCGKTFAWQTQYRRHMNKHSGIFKCEKCEKTFSSKTVLIAHKLMHASEKPFKCDECGKIFKWRIQWQSHINKHEGKYKCQECDKDFSSAGSLTRHEATHSGDRPFKCSICDASFRWKNNLQSHLNKHAGLFTCKYCLKQMSCKRMLVQHLMSHKNLRPHKCELCEKSFTWKAQLCAHLNIHKGVFTCEICGKILASKKSLENHRKSIHEKNVIEPNQQKIVTNFENLTQMEEIFVNPTQIEITIESNGISSDKPYRCTFCSKTFTRKYQCGQHMNKHNGIFKCGFCAKQFVSKESLNSHRSIHTNVKKFICDECGKSFAWKAQWRLHRNQHKGMYFCETCNKQFSSNQSLIRHQSGHKNERPFKCSYCDKTFRWKSNWQSHLHKHFGGFECEICKRKFSTKQFLKEHRMSHDKERPYKCSMCEKSFTWRTQLCAHVNRHKGKYTCQNCHKEFASRRSLTHHKCKLRVEVPSDCEELTEYLNRSEMSTKNKDENCDFEVGLNQCL